MIMAALFMVIVSPRQIRAAEAGTMMSNAVNISFGSSYTKTWMTRNNHLNHYCKITVPQKGIVNISATKPYDSEGEYGRMYFTLYNSNGEGVWGSETYYTRDGALDRYVFNVGLNPGVYYLTLKPGFNVISGYITTRYNISFKATPYAEAEPNDSIALGTLMQTGPIYQGYFGADGSDYDEEDFWRFQLDAGATYKIAVGNCAKITNTTTIIKLNDPSGSSTSIGSKLASAADANGMNYIQYTPKHSGLYSLRVYNYHKEQFAYTVSVTKLSAPAAANPAPTAAAPARTTAAPAASASAQPAQVTAPKKLNMKYAKFYKKGTIDVEYGNVSGRNISYVEVQAAKNKSFTKGLRKRNVHKKYTGIYFSGFKKGTYFVRVRPVLKSGGQVYTAPWSKVKKVKIKK